MNSAKTAVYCRLALANDGLFSEKERAMLDFADDNGYAPRVCYRDNGQSGIYLDRPGLRSLLHDICSGGIERVIVANISRLSRDYFNTDKLLRFFAGHGVEFVSVGDGVTADGYLLFADGLEKMILSQRRGQRS
jgi:DNA invertase Pin-like site-specific DNA recombinase